MIRQKQEAYLLNRHCGEVAHELAKLYDDTVDKEIKQATKADLAHLYQLAERKNLLLWRDSLSDNEPGADKGSQQNSPPDLISLKLLELFCGELERILCYRTHLRSLEDDHVSLQYVSLRREAIEASRELRRARGLENDAGQFFCEPEADVDREAWMSKASWSIDEFVAFSMGKSPEIVSTEKLAPFWRPHSSPFREEYQRRLDKVNRSAAIGKLKPHDVPHRFLDWAHEAGMPLVGFDGGDPRQTTNTDRVHGGTLHSLYKIILNLSFEINGSSDISNKMKFVSDIVSKMKESELQNRLHLDEKTMTRHIENATEWASSKGLLTVKNPPVAFRKIPKK